MVEALGAHDLLYQLRSTGTDSLTSFIDVHSNPLPHEALHAEILFAGFKVSGRVRASRPVIVPQECPKKGLIGTS